MSLGLFLSWQPPLLIFKISFRAKTLSELSIAPALTDCPPASFPSDSEDQEHLSVPLQRFLASPKAGCLFISLDGFGSNPLKNLAEPAGHQEAESGQKGWEFWIPTRTLSQRDEGKELCPGPSGDAASPSSLDSSSLQAAPRASDPTDPSKCGPLPTRVPQCHCRCLGGAGVPQGSIQGCSGCCRAIPRDAGLSLGVTIVTEQHLCSPAGNLLFHPTLRWTPFLPLHKGNSKSSPRRVSSSTPSHTRFYPTEKQDPAREPASSILQGVQEDGGWSFSLTQIYNCEWDKIRGFLTLVVNRSLSRLKTSNTLFFFLIVKCLY